MAVWTLHGTVAYRSMDRKKVVMLSTAVTKATSCSERRRESVTTRKRNGRVTCPDVTVNIIQIRILDHVMHAVTLAMSSNRTTKSNEGQGSYCFRL